MEFADCIRWFVFSYNQVYVEENISFALVKLTMVELECPREGGKVTVTVHPFV